MLINWFTVVAQILNLLILIWLLKRFLYKPILKAIDEREKQIAAKIADAEAKSVAAGKDRDEFQKKNSDFDAQKSAAWNKATGDIKIERQRLMDEAHKDSDTLRINLATSLQQEQADMGVEIARLTEDEVFDIARKTLRDLADDSLEQRIVGVFIKRLTQLNADEKKKLGNAFLSAKSPLEIRSHFDLIPAQQDDIERSLKGLLGDAIQFKFNTIPELISGIELHANGYKLAWSISAYVGSMEKTIIAALHTKSNVNRKAKDDGQ